MDYTKKPIKENPGKNANFLSKLCFLWIIPFLYKGKNGLTTDDLIQHLDIDSSAALGDKLEREWDKQVELSKKTKRKEILRFALYHTFFSSIAYEGILQTVSLGLKSSVPFVLQQLLKQFQIRTKIFENKYVTYNSSNVSDEPSINYFNNQSKISNKLIDSNAKMIYHDKFEQFLHLIWDDVYCLSCIIIIFLVVASILGLHSDLRQRLVGARMRIACSSLIYRKTIRLSKKSSSQISTGYLINLLSNDVLRFDAGFIYIHYLWILPIQSCFICYLIYRDIGIASVIGVCILILQTIPIQTGLSQLSAKLRTKVAIRTDQRVGIMNEIIQGIQVIKMYAWEKPFHAVVAAIRQREIKQVKFASYVSGIYLSARVYTARTSLFITVLSVYLLNYDINTDIVFAMSQYYNCLQLTTATFYPLAITCGAEAIAAIKRIEEYLLMGDANKEITLNTNKQQTDDLTISNIQYSANENAIEVHNVTATWTDEPERLTLNNISMNVKVGQLCAIIGQVGAGKSSIFNLLLKELPRSLGNIYVNGDISYAAQEPWLFSTTVRNNILFGEIYDRKRYDKIVNLCALQTDFKQLPYGDKSIVGEKGVILSGGQRARISLARAIYKPAKIYLLDDPLSAVDVHVGKHLFEQIIGPDGRLANESATRILITHQIHFLKKADVIIIIENGKIIRQGSYQELFKSKVDFASLLKSSEEDIDDDNDNGGAGCNHFNSEYNSNSNNNSGIFKRHRSSLFGSRRSRKISDSSDDLINDTAEEIETKETQTEGHVSLEIWKKYFKSSGNTYMLITLTLVLILSQVLISSVDYFVKYLTLHEFYRINNIVTILTTKECFYIYGGLITACVLICYLRCYLFLNVCMGSSNTLHNQMFEHLLNTPMRFFDTNPSGRILNRFSKDMGSVDELLPKTMLESLQILLVMIGILTTIAIENPFMIFALMISSIFYAIILNLYLRPSQDLKRFEGSSKSPVFSHLSYTLSGLTTIRSRCLQKKLIEEFDNLQNVHSPIWQMVVTSSTALGLWLDLICIGFVACVTFSFIFIDNQEFSGTAGLAITQSLLLTGMLQYGLKQTTEAIQQFTSAERILQYGDLNKEPNSIKKPDENWPTNGTIKFNNLSLRYDLDKPFVLKNLFIHIESNWKVGVIGRTGAGKSSLINALFRLSPIEGEILIDGLDTSHISLESLRSKISIIPQDPVLFSATIRYNLDPFNLFSDDVLWRSLEDVELKQAVSSLDYLVTEGGSNFSIGQRQLLCLARALLRNNKILVLDEATANCDPQTDILIQQTIRIKFDQCTVITVAHRLHTVMDSDRVLVMDNGYAKEFDIPYVLLQNENGLLRNLVESTGIQESETLQQIAKDKYNNSM